MYFGRISGTDFVKDLCSFIFVKDPRFFSHTKKVFFSYREQQRYILLLSLHALFLKRTPFFSSFYDLRDIMAQNVSHCIFCSDLFHPKSLPCSVISSIRCIIHPVCPFCQNMLQASQKKCLTGSFQPVMVSGLFYCFPVQDIQTTDLFPILIVFLCPCFLPFFHRRTLFFGKDQFFS